MGQVLHGCAATTEVVEAVLTINGRQDFFVAPARAS